MKDTDKSIQTQLNLEDPDTNVKALADLSHALYHAGKRIFWFVWFVIEGGRSIEDDMYDLQSQT